MSGLVKSIVLVALLSSAALANASDPDSPLRKFDEFGDIKCEDEYARLDNFAIQLQHEPEAEGVIIFYGGKTFRGRLPKRGEAEARTARIKPYLVQRRGIPANRITLINGGYTDEWKAQLWIVPRGVSTPSADTGIPIKKIRFSRGKVNPRDYRCRI